MTPTLPQTPFEASQIVACDNERFGKHFRAMVNSSNQSDTHPEMSLIFNPTSSHFDDQERTMLI